MTPLPLINATTTDHDAHINCRHCDYSTAGSDVRVAGISHVKKTGHTVVVVSRQTERITPA